MQRPPPTSMYEALLAASVRHIGRSFHPADGDLLLERLQDARRRLEHCEDRKPSDVATRVAYHLDYDLALIHLCGYHGILCDPASFSHPTTERKRLERALQEAGVNVWGAREG